MSIDDLDHHRVRVREELDWAYRASTSAAIHAHFKLAALHMNRVDELVRAAFEAAKLRVAAAAPRPDRAVGEERVLACC